MALRRCTDVNRLYLTNVNGDREFYHTGENANHDMTNELNRLNKHCLAAVTKPMLQTLKQQEKNLIVGALNVRPLQKHTEDVHTTKSSARKMFFASQKPGWTVELN